MAARANLVINDRAATPVAHTYTPDGGDPTTGVATWSEKTSVPAGNPQYTASYRSSGGQLRSTIRLRIPVVQTQTINGVSTPVVVRTAYLELSTRFDALSTTQERADAVGLMYNSLATAQAQINDLLVNATPMY